MENNVENLAADQVDSPSVDQVSVDTPFVPEDDGIDWNDPSSFDNDGLLDDVLNDNRGITPSAKAPEETAPTVEVQEQESEESPVEETATEESTEESSTEENDSEVETEDSPPEDLNLIDVSDLDENDKFELEMHGKKVQWNWSEIQNQLKRSESASEKSREAIAEKEKYEQLQSELLEERKTIQSTNAANQMHPALQSKLAEVQNAQQVANKAFEEESIDFTFLKEKANRVENEFNKMTQEYNAHLQQQQAFARNQQLKEMRDLGLGHLLKEGKAQEDYLGYIGTFKPETQAAIRGIAELNAIASDAMKWRESQTKGTKNIAPKKSIKSLKSGNKGRTAVKKTVESKQSGIDASVVGNEIDRDTDAFLDRYFANR